MIGEQVPGLFTRFGAPNCPRQCIALPLCHLRDQLGAPSSRQRGLLFAARFLPSSAAISQRRPSQNAVDPATQQSLQNSIMCLQSQPVDHILTSSPARPVLRRR
jgi:hypothetical protein